MLPDLKNTPALLALIALAPALLAWWSGRRMAARVTDAAFSERLHAEQRKRGFALGISGVLLACLSPGALFWTLPLLIGALVASGYPLRRVIYRETWSFGAYLAFFGRLIVAWFGFWIALAALPAVSRLAGAYDWLMAAPVGVILLIWNDRFSSVFRWIVRSRPLEDGALAARCRVLANSCGLGPVRFERIDLHGGVIANALALPSLRQPSVLFSSTLLDRFSEDEVVAICAHELAHHEHYNADRLRQLTRVSVLLILCGVTWAPAARLGGIESPLLASVLWLGVLATTLIVRARNKQPQESVCDVRAVQMTGQPEHLIAALIRLHEIARVPRRMESQQERASTHPSLARRIRDIRKAAGTLPVQLPAPATFRSADAHRMVTFGNGGLDWVESEAVTHHLNYAHLTELRIHARGGSSPRLVAVGGNQRWEMSLVAGDIARVQEVLDVLDVQLADPLPPRALPFLSARTALVFLVALILSLGQAAAAFVALLAVVRPAPQVLLAAGLAALTGASLALRTGGAAGEVTALVAVPVAIAGLVMLALARHKRGESGGGARTAVAGLAIASLLALALLALDGLDVVHLHQSALGSTAVPVFLVALAGALGASHVRREQLAGAAAVGLAASVVLVASPAFLDAFGRDPFLLQSPPIAFVDLEGPAEAGFTLPPTAVRAALSPDGRHVIVADQRGMHDDEPTFLVGPVGGSLKALHADNVVFADDDHLLVLESTDAAATLEKVRLDDIRAVAWTAELPDVRGASLSFDIMTGRWSMTGWTSLFDVVYVAGTIGRTHAERRQWPLAPVENAYVGAVGSRGARAVVVQTRYDRGALGRMLPAASPWALRLQPFRRTSHVLLLEDGRMKELSASRLEADCLAGAADDEDLVCTVYDGTRTRVVRIDAADGSVSPIGYLPGRLVCDRETTRGWLTGWAGATHVAIRLATRQAFRPPDDAAVVHMSVSGDRIAVVSLADDGMRVETYAIPK